MVPLAGAYPGRPVLLGHRGTRTYAPENTHAAFQLALAQGADGVEFDVRQDADGVPVVIHDATLWRTGGSPAAVRATRVAALQVQVPHGYPGPAPVPRPRRSSCAAPSAA